MDRDQINQDITNSLHIQQTNYWIVHWINWI